ncbi:MAG: hypothetical protein LBQ34_07700, partial [Alphaproteobacteria bacterium]|nr:hypothetical protein [Alphaproteobacteria bacterium]
MDKSNSLSNPNNLDSDSNENFLNRLDVHTNFEHQKQKTEDMRHQQYSTQPYYKLKHYKIGKNNEIIVDKNEDILCIIDMKSNATLWDWLFSIFSALAGIYFIFFE